MKEFTNVHIHIFSGECAPPSFLKNIPSGLVRKHPKTIKKLIQSRFGRAVIVSIASRLSKNPSRTRGGFSKYISFLEIGTSPNQQVVFEKALLPAKNLSPKPKMVVLTLDMDYMDETSKPLINFNTQLREVKRIKKYYPEECLPFLSVDPRRLQGESLLIWAKKYFEHGVRNSETKEILPFFKGIKLYPALGYFPFDPAFDALFAYAEKKGIPIMTHCTRVGSQYIGKHIKTLIPRKPAMLASDVITPEYKEAKSEIEARIEKYYTAGPPWMGYSLKRNNDMACDLFGHPQNYIPILLKYPKLKICIAHMGGASEILATREKKEGVQEMDGYNWFELLKKLMKIYPNLYTDISYTLYALAPHSKHSKKNAAYCKAQIVQFLNEGSDFGLLGERVLFGTDYFMTEQEATEAELYNIAAEHLGNWFNKMSGENCKRYLG